MTPIEMWWLSLAIFAAVVVVVAVLLGLVIDAARRVDRHAQDIWTVGKQIAGNTVSIWMLEQAENNSRRLQEAARSAERTLRSMDETLRALAESSGGGR